MTDFFDDTTSNYSELEVSNSRAAKNNVKK